MTAQRWSQIKEVFFAARETAEEDRVAYLDSACGEVGSCVLKSNASSPRTTG